MAKTLFDRLKFTQRTWKSDAERIRDSQKRARGQAAAPMLKAMQSARAITQARKPKIEPMSAYKGRLMKSAKETSDFVNDQKDMERGEHGVLHPSKPIPDAVDRARRYSTQHDDTARALDMPTKIERTTRNQIQQARTAAREATPGPRPKAPAQTQTQAAPSALDKVKGLLRSGKYKTRTA